MSAFDKVVLAGLVVLAIPVLITPAGWVFGVLLGALWLALTYGGRELLEIEKQRRQGERGRAAEIRGHVRDGGDRR